MFVDTHCHLSMMVKTDETMPLNAEHLRAIDVVIEQAAEAGVGALINVGADIQGSHEAVCVAKKFAPVYATLGIHPTDCGRLSPRELKDGLDQFKKLLADKQANKVVAIGEIGLDFYHKPYDAQRQQDFFKAQIELALTYDLPVVLHIREAGDEVLKVLEEYVQNKLRGVAHCFLQSADFAQTILEWGFYVGLDAPITYPKNDVLRALFKTLPLERIVLETDAPFLPPQAFRGQKNSPVYIPLIAQALADLQEKNVAAVEQTTTANAKKLFGI